MTQLTSLKDHPGRPEERESMERRKQGDPVGGFAAALERADSDQEEAE